MESFNRAARILGVSHVAVKVRDIETSLAFYRDFLGFPEQYRLNHRGSDTLLLVTLKVSDDQWIELFPGLTPGDDRLHQIAYRVGDAEGFRAHLAASGLSVPESVSRAQIGNLGFTTRDVEGYTLEFVEYTPEGRTCEDAGKHLAETRIAERITHAGVATANADRTLHFYRDILGFEEGWRGSKDDAFVSWVNMNLPGSDDYVELMLEESVTPHFCLGVPDLEATCITLEARRDSVGYTRPIEMRVGRNRKRQINLFDPDGVRVEIMEPSTIDGNAAPSVTLPLPIH